MLQENNIWFAPVNVLYHYARLESVTPKTKQKSKAFRKAREAHLVALALIGIIKVQGIDYWMQLVDDKDGFPDIKTARLLLGPNIPKELETQDVEVVEFGTYSPEGIVDFLKKTKLSPKNTYPKKTSILCYISKTTELPSYKEIHTDLKNSTSNCDVFILGKTDPANPEYTLCQVHPSIEILVSYNVMEEAFKRKWTGVRRFNYGADSNLNELYLPDEKHYPFENLNI